MKRILFPALLLISTAAFAHSGGLDAQGGHNDRAASTYHFHQGLLAGETFATKQQATTALQVEVAPAPTEELPRSQLAPVPPGQIRLASFRGGGVYISHGRDRKRQICVWRCLNDIPERTHFTGFRRLSFAMYERTHTDPKRQLYTESADRLAVSTDLAVP